MRHTLLSIVLLVACVASSAEAADRLHLRNGRSLVGEITEQDDDLIHIKTKFGIMRVATKDVARIENDVDVEIEETASTDTPAPPENTVEKSEQPETTDAAESVPEKKPETVTRAPVSRKRARAAVETAARHSPVVAKLLGLVRRLESADPLAREEAAVDIITEWPATSTTLALVFEIGSEVARVDAARLLRHARLGDTTEQVRTLFADPSADVRMQALRVAHARGMVDLERDVLAIVAGNSPWPIRQDAARALERIGGKDSFHTVVDVWVSESDPDRKSRIRRVLVAIAGEDLGNDGAAWAKAVDEAFLGERELRDPRGDAARRSARKVAGASSDG